MRATETSLACSLFHLFLFGVQQFPLYKLGWEEIKKLEKDVIVCNFVFAVGLVDLSLLVLMLLWKPSMETLPVLFVIVALWGMAEAIMFTQLVSE